jgi:hypothetical protein
MEARCDLVLVGQGDYQLCPCPGGSILNALRDKNQRRAVGRKTIENILVDEPLYVELPQYELLARPVVAYETGVLMYLARTATTLHSAAQLTQSTPSLLKPR